MSRRNLSVRVFILLAVLVVTAMMLVYGYRIHGHRPLAVQPPDGSSFLYAKMLVAFAASLLILYAFRTEVIVERNFRFGPTAGAGMVLSASGVLAAVYLAVFEPVRLNAMIQELQPISVMTELGFAIALIPLVLAALRLRKTGAGAILGIPGWVLASGMALAVFLIAMEEASWGQHWIGWSTPEAFEANRQNETNFHNFYTHRFELAFYSVSTAAFIMFPALWPKGRLEMLRGVDFYVPPAAFGLVFLPVSALLFDEWNALPQEIPVFLGFLSAAIIAYRMTLPVQRMIGFAMVALMVLAQTAILLFAFGLPEGYEVSEIRELYISAGVLTYAVILFRRTRGARV